MGVCFSNIKLKKYKNRRSTTSSNGSLEVQRSPEYCLLNLCNAFNDRDSRTFDFTKISLLLKNNPRMNINKIKDEYGRTPFHLLCFEDNKELMQLFISRNSNLSEFDNTGETPIHYCTYYGTHDNIIFLLRNGVDINEKSKKGDTPLMIAAEKDNKKTLSFLLKNSANINIQNKENQDALTKATYKNQKENIDFLIEKGADIQLVLFNLIKTKKEKMMKFIIKKYSEKFSIQNKPDEIDFEFLLYDYPILKDKYGQIIKETENNSSKFIEIRLKYLFLKLGLKC